LYLVYTPDQEVSVSAPFTGHNDQEADLAEHAITAREIFEISPASQGRFSITRQGSAASSPSPPKTASPTPPPFHQLPPSSRTPRTFFLIDRFTNTARVMYVSNDVIVNGNTVSPLLFNPYWKKKLTSLAEKQPFLLDHKTFG
jgi:hypothetical protein